MKYQSFANLTSSVGSSFSEQVSLLCLRVKVEVQVTSFTSDQSKINQEEKNINQPFSSHP